MSDLGTLVATMTLKSDAFKKGIDDANRSLGTLVSAVSQAKGFIAGFLTFQVAKGAFNWINDGIEKLDDLGAEAERVGVSAQALKELQYAAELSDTAAESLNAGLEKMNKVLGDATEAGGKTAQVLQQRIGKSLKEIADQGPATTLLDVADAVSKIQEPMARAAAVTDIFGKSGQSLIGILSKGRSGIIELRREAREFYGTELGSLANRAGEADDAMKRLNAAFESLKFAAASELAPALAATFNGLAISIRGVGSILKSIGSEIESLVMDLKEIGVVVKELISGGGVEGARTALAQHIDQQRKLALPSGVGFAFPSDVAGTPALHSEKAPSLKNPALELSTKEGFGVIARALSGRTATNEQKELVAIGKKQVDATKAVENAVRKLAIAPKGPPF